MKNQLKVALAQIAPVWLNKQATIDPVIENIRSAAKEGAELLIFGEAFLPGYAFWLAYIDGAAWELAVNKELHAHYAHNSIIYH